MKTKGTKDNFRVVVTPRSLTNFGFASFSRGLFYSGPNAQEQWEKDMQARCEEIERSIKRHTDNIDSIDIEFDQEFVCSHCGSSWTEESDTYNGGCCDQDVAKNPDATTEETL